MKGENGGEVGMKWEVSLVVVVVVVAVSDVLVADWWAPCLTQLKLAL